MIANPKERHGPKAKVRSSATKTARKTISRGSNKERGTRAAKPAAARPRAKRTGTKQEQLIALLRSQEGATVEEVAKRFGWQFHTVRGAIAGALKKKLGLGVSSDKVEGRGRVYRIAD
jgi:hypothetical protein